MAKVLVVDDDRDFVNWVNRKLTTEGYEVKTANNGPDALTIATQEHPEVILLDVMMPGMDGYETCRLLKADADLNPIPVIMATAKDQADEYIQGLDAGASDYVTKPIVLPVLLARLLECR